MNIRTKSLFHFTKKLKTLLDILKDGAFWPKYYLEDMTWVDGVSFFHAWPMVCFCDIPISRLREHTDFYGSYGIGLSRAWGRDHGLNPLLYVSPDSFLSNYISGLRSNPNLKDPGLRTAALVLFAHCKPLEGRQGNVVIRDFYSECEWRYVPFVEQGAQHGFSLSDEQYHNERILHEANAERRKDSMIEFQPTDTRYLFVKSSEDVPKLVDFVGENFRDYASNVRKVLMTRIVSLDELSSDL